MPKIKIICNLQQKNVLIEALTNGNVCAFASDINTKMKCIADCEKCCEDNIEFVIEENKNEMA